MDFSTNTTEPAFVPREAGDIANMRANSDTSIDEIDDAMASKQLQPALEANDTDANDDSDLDWSGSEHADDNTPELSGSLPPAVLEQQKSNGPLVQQRGDVRDVGFSEQGTFIPGMETMRASATRNPIVITPIRQSLVKPQSDAEVQLDVWY